MSNEDTRLAAQIAREVGRALLDLRASFGAVHDERSRRSLMDAGDQMAQRLIARRLGEERPSDAVLSEEAPDSLHRLNAPRVWIIDPLDGTVEFGMGRADFAVHVALWSRDDRLGPEQAGALSAAAVDLPGLGEAWSTGRARPAAPLPTHRPLRMAVSRTRPPDGLDKLLADMSADLAAEGITDLGIEAAHIGSVGAKVGEVIAGRAEAYLHPGGLREWDLAAPYACALTHGLVALGPAQPFNQMPPVVGPVLIAHPQLARVLVSDAG